MSRAKRAIGVRGSRGLAVTMLAAAAALLALCCASSPEGEAKPEAVSAVSLVAEAEGLTASELPDLPPAGRVLVVYYTTGNAAERVAKDLASLYSADLERIEDKKPRNWGFMGGGFASSMGQASPIKDPVHDPAAYDRVFVLSPVWAWRMAPPVRSWLRWAKGRLPELSFGTISGDTEPGKIVAKMAKESGTTPYSYAGFSERDFLPENRGLYLEKFRYLTGQRSRAED